jgi:peptide/nickel transport system substrate-binding protein
MYNTLIRRNPSDGLRTVVPELATSWDIAADGMSYVFRLRDGVKWHDGTPFSAEDVKATFDRIISPPDGIVIPAKTLFDAIGKIEIVDRLTVRMVLKEPRVWLFDIFTHSGGPGMVYSKKALTENNNDLRKVITPGTGPFVFKDHKAAEKWTFERNPNYWNKELPYVDSVEMLHVPAWTDRGTAVLTGQADFSWNVSRDTFEEGQKRKDIVGTALLANFGALDVVWNNSRAPYTDVRVRRAIHLAINRHDAVRAYREEWNNVSAWMSPGAEGALPYDQLIKLPGYREDNKADIAEAKKLLAEAGFPDGKGFHVVDLVAASVPGHSQVLAPFFADQLKRNLGIEVKIRVVERALISQEYKKEFDMVLGTLYHSPVQNHTPLWQVVWTTGASQNWSRYSNPEFDKVVADLNKELDPVKRAALFRKGEELLGANPPQYHFGFTSHMPMWRNYVKGIVLETRIMTEWGKFETIWLDK